MMQWARGTNIIAFAARFEEQCSVRLKWLSVMKCILWRHVWLVDALVRIPWAGTEIHKGASGSSGGALDAGNCYSKTLKPYSVHCIGCQIWVISGACQWGVSLWTNAELYTIKALVMGRSRSLLSRTPVLPLSFLTHWLLLMILQATKLADLYKQSSDEWSNKSNELEGVIKAIEVTFQKTQFVYFSCGSDGNNIVRREEKFRCGQKLPKWKIVWFQSLLWFFSPSRRLCFLTNDVCPK